ncbi:hypothetical protein ABK040_005913 [Willaertia magna]
MSQSILEIDNFQDKNDDEEDEESDKKINKNRKRRSSSKSNNNNKNGSFVLNTSTTSINYNLEKEKERWEESEYVQTIFQLRSLGDLKKCLIYCQEKRKLLLENEQDLTKRSTIPFLLYLYAEICFLSGKEELALKEYNLCLEFCKDLSYYCLQGNCLYRIGLLFKQVENYETCLKYFENSLEIFLKLSQEKPSEFTLHQIKTTLEIATIYFLRKEQEKAIQILDKSLADLINIEKECSEGDATILKIKILHLLSLNHLHLERIQKSFQLFEKAIDISEKLIINQGFIRDTSINTISSPWDVNLPLISKEDISKSILLYISNISFLSFEVLIDNIKEMKEKSLNYLLKCIDLLSSDDKSLIPIKFDLFYQLGSLSYESNKIQSYAYFKRALNFVESLEDTILCQYGVFLSSKNSTTHFSDESITFIIETMLDSILHLLEKDVPLMKPLRVNFFEKEPITIQRIISDIIELYTNNEGEYLQPLKALEIIEMTHAYNFKKELAKNMNYKISSEMTIDQMKNILIRHQKTFPNTDNSIVIYYSMLDNNSIGIWTFTGIKLEKVNFTISKKEDYDLKQQIINMTEYVKQKDVTKLNLILSEFYNLFIKPIEYYLNSIESNKMITIIPQSGPLLMIPFNGLFNQQLNYFLIDKYCIDIQPSISFIDFRFELMKRKLNCTKERLLESLFISTDKSFDERMSMFNNKLPNSKVLLSTESNRNQIIKIINQTQPVAIQLLCNLSKNSLTLDSSNNELISFDEISKGILEIENVDLLSIPYTFIELQLLKQRDLHDLLKTFYSSQCFSILTNRWKIRKSNKYYSLVIYLFFIKATKEKVYKPFALRQAILETFKDLNTKLQKTPIWIGLLLIP